LQVVHWLRLYLAQFGVLVKHILSFELEQACVSYWSAVHAAVHDLHILSFEPEHACASYWSFEQALAQVVHILSCLMEHVCDSYLFDGAAPASLYLLAK
jgi:hypothetical protein